MNVIAFIPARGGSKGIQNKNLQEIGGEALVIRSIFHALESEILSNIIVSTDSEIIIGSIREKFNDALILDDSKIGNLFELNQKLVIHKRDPQLASDKSLVGETIKKICTLINSNTRVEFGVLMMQPTSPFRKPNEVDHFLRSHISEGTISPAVSVKEVIDSHPARMYQSIDHKLSHIGFLKDLEFAPRQLLPKFYLRDGSFYLLNQNQAIKGAMVSENSKFSIREFPWNLNIDSIEDLEFARYVDGTF